ncbi:MAG: radical SAM family heme chaperone HemW, partial [Nitrospirae bacterium]|nr:radical SAM family heme chaperone HemW [Nitrospirota bacterium]
CDFLSFPYDESLAKKYTDSLCKELILKKSYAKKLKTIYIGGGTPSVLSQKCFKQLFKCLKDNFNFSPSIEITAEVNPGTLDESKIDTFLSLGINRLSIGVQSFNDNELKTLGRIHTADEAVGSIEMIKKAGFKNFSMDLMYGIPGQTMGSWQENMSKTIAFTPTHISSYELTPEKNTPLYEFIESCRIKMPDEELVLEMYNRAIDYYSNNGYEHYEISNFALLGYKCAHNLNYWDRGEYIGAGAGAHSFINGIRSKNTEDIDSYIEYLNDGNIPEIESTTITNADALKEFIFLGLRKMEGINLSKAKDLGTNIIAVSGELITEGYIEIKNNHLILTRKGIVISNEIIAGLFEKLRLD